MLTLNQLLIVSCYTVTLLCLVSSVGLCEAADTQTDLIECYSCEGKGDDNDCLVLSDLNSHVLICEENVTVCDQAAYLPPGGVLHLHAATQNIMVIRSCAPAGAVEGCRTSNGVTICACEGTRCNGENGWKLLGVEEPTTTVSSGSSSSLRGQIILHSLLITKLFVALL